MRPASTRCLSSLLMLAVAPRAARAVESREVISDMPVKLRFVGLAGEHCDLSIRDVSLAPGDVYCPSISDSQFVTTTVSMPVPDEDVTPIITNDSPSGMTSYRAWFWLFQ